MTDVSAIVLAAGKSSRMGRLKQLLPWGNRTIIEHVVETLRETRVCGVVVVLGAHAVEIQGVLAKRLLTCVMNPDVEGDMCSSLRCGIRETPAHHAMLVALGDQPLISTALVNRLLDEAAQHPQGIIIPIYQGKRGHPMIIPATYRDELLAWSDPGGLKTFRDRHAEHLVEVLVGSDEVLIDLDYPHEYEQALLRLQQGSA